MLIKLKKNQATIAWETIPSDIKILEIFGGQVEEIDFKNVNKFKDLEILSICNCPLTRIDLQSINLDKLKVLKIKNSMIQEFELPKLIYLEKLCLSNNEIKSVPKSIENVFSLEELDLSNNKIETISCELRNLKNLKRLNFEHNKLRKFEFKKEELAKLNHLALSENEFDESEKMRINQEFNIWF